MGNHRTLKVAGLTKSYQGRQVVRGVSLHVESGEVVALLGPNGAGKTTLFNILLDLIKPSTGSVTSHNIEVSQHEDWKKFTGSFIDESFLIGYLTPEEYFEFIGDLRGMNKADIASFLNQFDEFFNGEIIGKKKYLRDLSKGNQKKAGIIAAMMGNPKVIILDEPFANLDPTTQIRLKTIIKKLTENKEITVLISSHDLTHITEVCERIVVLDKGVLVKDLKTSTATLKELESYFSV